MKIVVADDLPASAIELLRAEGWDVDARSGRKPPELAADLADADAIVVRSATKVTADLIAAAPSLRAIARAGTGVDNVDVDAASARGIVVMNAPGANSISVAELAMAQLLALARKIPAADASMKQGKWDKKSFLGEEVRGKVLGLAGLGRIGQEVARRARAFEMTLLAHDPFISAQVARDLGVELVTLDELCERADFLSLHMPSTPQTRHIFNADRLARCKNGHPHHQHRARRSDRRDRHWLTRSRAARSAAPRSTCSSRSRPTDHTLQMLPQVVATPHIAASTREGQELVGVETATRAPRFSQERHHSQRRQFSVAAARRISAAAAVCRRSPRQLGLPARADGRCTHRGRRAFATTASWRAASNPLILSAVLVGLFRAILSESVTPVNAMAVAAAPRHRDHASRKAAAIATIPASSPSSCTPALAIAGSKAPSCAASRVW